MTSIIKADDGVVSGVTGITSTADNSGILEFQAVNQQVSMANVTGSMTLPKGTTAQRPGTPVTGMQRFNTTTGYPEWYDGTTWQQIQPATYPVEFLLVAGGGSGGSGNGGSGGGGAGGAIDSSYTVSSGLSYPITIGAGGAQTVNANNIVGNDGSNSTVFSQTAIGGGGGGAWQSQNGRSGGSGGGGGGSSGSAGGSGGSGTSGQGNAGGAGLNSASPYAGGGGGGAGAVGGSTTGSPVSSGGVGINWKSLGTYYAGGGGAGTENGNTSGNGGNGGGGRGGYNDVNGTAGTANTGGGGGGGGYPSNRIGGAGGSGIVIIRYLGSQRGTGGTVTSSGGYTYHTFTNSGTYTA